jgi:hypothetical protein
VESLANALQYVNIAAFGVLALVCLRAWRTNRGAATFWAFATFGLLALVAITGPVVDAADDPSGWITKGLRAGGGLFAYYRSR